jgi:hypothetical protein
MRTLAKVGRAWPNILRYIPTFHSSCPPVDPTTPLSTCALEPLWDTWTRSMNDDRETDRNEAEAPVPRVIRTCLCALWQKSAEHGPTCRLTWAAKNLDRLCSKRPVLLARYKTIKKRGRLCDAVGEVLSVQCDWRLPCMCIRLLHDTCCSRMRGCIGPGRASRT